MRKRRWLLWAVPAVLILIVALTLPEYIEVVKTNRRVSEAVNFPSSGYQEAHSDLVAEAVARVYRNPDYPDWLFLLIDVTISNVGEHAYKNVIAAAKVDHVNNLCEYGVIPVHMKEPITMDPGESPPARLAFGWSTPMRTLTTEEFEDLPSILGEPLLIKVVHDGGVELLTVSPVVDIVQ